MSESVGVRTDLPQHRGVERLQQRRVAALLVQSGGPGEQRHSGRNGQHGRGVDQGRRVGAQPSGPFRQHLAQAARHPQGRRVRPVR